jgi:hypothetical protein
MAWYNPKDWSVNGNKLWPAAIGGVLGLAAGPLGAVAGAGLGYAATSMYNKANPKGTPGFTGYDPAYYYSIMAEQQQALMEGQMEMQAKAAAQQADLQKQQMDLAREQMLKQEQMAQLANQESQKNPSDFAQSNAADTRRKQLLRRGLMSTFTRYAQASGGSSSAMPAKAEKLGG